MLGHHASEDRDTSDGAHDENKKKAKIQKKPIKKKKEDDVGIERANTETASEDGQVFSPKKGQKKKSVEKKHKRSRGDSDISDEEAVQQSKKKRGPRTPPITTKEGLVEISNDKDLTIEDPQRKEDTAFSDWSDEDVPDRAELTESEHAATAAAPGRTSSPSSLPPPPPPVAAAPTMTASATLATAATAISTFSPCATTISSSVIPTNTSEDSHRKCHKTRAEKVEAPHVMLRVGISKKLAGSELFTKVKETCQRLLEKPKDADNLFEHELGALNMAALLRKEERASLLSNLGPCCKALCFRRDSAIRKQLVKNEKGTVKQAYTSTPMVDNELLRLSLRLFKRKTTCHAPGHEKTEDSKLAQPIVQQELCVS
uniref:Zinc finger CCCH-type containing 13 n=1 Tax=Myotis myotis TaxID=51298 RepID=A0A7J7ZC08_MYOMY|nr:zinc finger CCCH-type containing 13 [Myotis myotis]